MKTDEKIAALEAQLEKEKAKQLYVVYYSPGTLFAEQSRFKVEERDIAAAAGRAKVDVVERHNAKPFGFRFTDGNGELLSGMYYLTGKLVRYDEVPDDKEHSTMRSNMRCNDMPIAVENNNSWRYTGRFDEDDVIVDWDGNVVQRGDDPELVAYRAEFKRRRKADEL